MRVLVTGGCGFIGTNLVHHLLSRFADLTVVDLDLLTYAGNLGNHARLSQAQAGRHLVRRVDVADPAAVGAVFDELSPFERVFHLAAESHVDRSITAGAVFARTNVVGTQVMLEAARHHGVGRFVLVSTDEVYGSAPPGVRFTESSPLSPSSPYAASKAGADLLALAHQHTFPDMDVLIGRCSNNYGPYQFPEKLIPLMLVNALQGQPLPIYGDGRQVRDWVHVVDHCRALWAVAESGEAGQIYNIGADNELENLALVKALLRLVDGDESLIQFVTDRPGHDRRYAIDSTKLRAQTGWEPSIDLQTGLAETVAWYRDHRQWSAQVRSGAYRQFYEQWYGDRLERNGGQADDASPEPESS